MKFNERKMFLYDEEVFKRSDTTTALRIYKEYIQKHSPRPTPKFFEVDRGGTEFDQLWHMPTGPRTQFSRTIDLPVLNVFEKPDWRLTKLGIVPQRRDKFIASNLHLQEYDYWPERGDQVFWNGYRYQIINVVLDPSAYWQQTNVWLGLYMEAIIVPEGDARPLTDLGVTIPAEKSPDGYKEVALKPQKPLPEK